MKKIIIGILMLLCNNIYSQEVKSLSLEECIKIGLENSKSLKISDSKVKSVEAKYKETEVAEYPTLKFTAGYTRLSDVGAPNFGPAASSIAKAFSPILDNYSTKITLNQPIFTGFRLSSATEIAEYNKNASILEFKKDEKELILNIRTAYWNYYRALKLKENIQQNITMVEAHLNDVKNFYKNGLATDNDVMKVKVQLSNTKLLMIDAENRFIITKSLYFPNKTNPRYQIAKEIIISLKKYREKFKNKHIIDDKIITSNNLNLANALLNLYKITQDKNYYNLSHQILNTILRKGFDNEILLHQINHKSIDKIYAFLDDYNALISLLISFYELTANINYLLKAKYFMDFVIKNYFDNKNFILHYTNKLLSDLPINPEIYQDTPIKSPVSHFLENIYYLSIAFENQDYENIFNTLIKNNFSTYKMYPIHYAGMLDIAFTSLKHKNEIVISFPKEVDINLLLKFHKKFLPQAIIFPCKSNEQIEIPILSDKLSIQNKITYYYCENFSCQAPLFDENQIFDLLGYYNLAH